jgi:hypothetical protein
MRKFIVTLLFLPLCFLGRSQLHIQSGAGVKITGDVLITFDGMDITNNDAATDFSSAVLRFKGTATTSISGTGTWVIKKLVLEKTGAQLNLAVPVQISSQLQFISGKLDLNNQVLTLAPGASMEGESENSRVTGAAGGWLQTTVSLNAPSSINPGNLGATITSSQNLGAVIIKRWHNPDVNSVSKVLRFYEIAPANNATLSATLRLQYFDAELNSNSEAGLQLFARNTAQNAWTLVDGTTADASINYVEKTGLASLQQYSIGSTMTALSLSWGSVSAGCRKGTIEIKWSTRQESGISNFIVQRSSNGSSWTDIGSVQAAGTSGSLKNYSYSDATAPSGITLNYRIAAVENESVDYSPVAATSGCKKTATVSLSPVPATTTTNLTVYSEETCKGAFKLYGADGRVYQQRTLNIETGLNRFIIDVSSLSGGMFYVQVELPEGILQTLPFVKQ